MALTEKEISSGGFALPCAGRLILGPKLPEQACSPSRSLAGVAAKLIHHVKQLSA